MGEAALNKGVFGRRESPAEIGAPKEPPVEPFHEGKSAWENESRVPTQEKAAGFPLE